MAKDPTIAIRDCLTEIEVLRDIASPNRQSSRLTR
jgi:hypothetical protein